MRVFERLDSLRSDDAIRPWVGQLTRNCCLDVIRASGRVVPVEEVEERVADDTIARLDEAMAVRDGLAHLGPECQEILDRFFARDESYRTIGDALDDPGRDDRQQDLPLPRPPPDGAGVDDGRIHPTAASCRHGDRMTTYDEERLGELLRLLPPAPAGWVEAAQELPWARAELDALVERAERDAAFRQALVDDLEDALRVAGVEPRPVVVEHLRRRLAGDGRPEPDGRRPTPGGALDTLPRRAGGAGALPVRRECGGGHRRHGGVARDDGRARLGRLGRRARHRIAGARAPRPPDERSATRTRPHSPRCS